MKKSTVILRLECCFQWRLDGAGRAVEGNDLDGIICNTGNQWLELVVPPAKGYCASCSRVSFCLQGMYRVSGCCIGKFGASIYAVSAQYRREMRHGKVLLGL